MSMSPSQSETRLLLENVRSSRCQVLVARFRLGVVSVSDSPIIVGAGALEADISLLLHVVAASSPDQVLAVSLEVWKERRMPRREREG